MPTFGQTIYSEGLNAYDYSWRNSGTADYGSYGGGPSRYGVFRFSNLNLTGKRIISVKLGMASSSAGWNQGKYVYFYQSAYPTYINTSVSGYQHITGNALGYLYQTFYNNTLSYIPADFLAARIAAGDNTFIIYGSGESSSSSTTFSSNYLKWTSVSIEVVWEEGYTACTPPTSFSLNPQVTASSSTLSWSGASGGVSNDITGYEVQYRDSADGVNWGAWSAAVATTSTAITFSAPTTGQRQFQVRTMGAAGAGYASAWAICPYTLRLSLPPTAPTVFTASPSIYESGNVTLSWSGSVTGNSAISRYELQYSTSTDGNNWSAWGALSTYNTSGTSGSTTTTLVNSNRGQYTHYQICAVDALSAASAFKISGNVRKNALPPAPTINAPVSGGTIYNPIPRVLVTLGPDADGHSQEISALGYSGSSTGCLTAGRKIVLRRSTALTAGGQQSISVTATDALGGASTMTVRSFFYTMPAFTDSVLAANVTAIKAAHLNELRTMVNTVRAYYGMTVKAWTDTIAAGITSLAGWKAHVLELRTAIEEVAALINSWDTASTLHRIVLPTWIEVTVNKPTVAVMTQMREAIALL